MISTMPDRVTIKRSDGVWRYRRSNEHPEDDSQRSLSADLGWDVQLDLLVTSETRVLADGSRTLDDGVGRVGATGP